MKNVTLAENSLKKELISYLNNFKYSVRVDKPALTMRIVRDYLQLLLFKRVPLRYVDIAVDYACNLRCTHCSAERLKKPGEKNRLGIADYRDLAKQCHDLGVITVGFTGGEPLVYSDLGSVIEAFKPSRTMISIKTNGTLLDEVWLKRLASWQVDSISIGLGPVPNEISRYDGIRGLPDSMSRSLDAAQQVLNHGFRLILGVVVSHENIRSANVIRIVEQTARMGTILIFGLAAPAGRWSAREDIVLSEEDRAYLQGLLQRYPHTRTDFESNFRRRGCGAVTEKLYITPYGDVIPCPFLQIGFGNVRRESLRTIRNRALSYPVLRGYPDRCLAADHYEFMADCLPPIFESERPPVDHTGIPRLRDYDEYGHKTA